MLPITEALLNVWHLSTGAK